MLDSLHSNLFQAIVSSFDNGTYNIIVEPLDAGYPPIMQGIPLMQVYASALGFKECNPYPAGAGVLCFNAGPERCYILGMIPQHDSGNFGFFSRSALKTADGNFDTQNTTGYAKSSAKLATHNQNRPTDITEGETAWVNDLGVALGLFQQFCSLKGSELAQIQCFLLDDLVRIISHNFQHWTALGEFNIWHDGKGIQAEFGATHLSTESLGTPSIKEKDGKPVFAEDGDTPKPDDSKDYYKFVDDDRLKAIERLKVFMGKLGDFLHVFMVKPDDKASRDLSGEIKGDFDLGLADLHVGLDGRVSIRTASALSIEKSNWIMVPHRVRTPEDPKGDDASELTYEKKDPFKFDNQFKYRENPTMYFLQMRDCVTYLQNKYNYKHFLKHEKDFNFSKDPETKEAKLSEVTDIDPYTEVKFPDYVLRNSGLFLMDNGGWMLKDAWGSAIVSEGGNIYLQPAKDLLTQPLRHSVTKAGGSIALNANKHVDISSTEEGMRVKTKKVQHYFAKDGGLIFQTDAKYVQAPSPTSEAYDDFGGILFVANESSVFNRAKNVVLDAENISISAEKLLGITAEQNMFVNSKENMFLMSDNNLYINGAKGTALISNANVSVAGNGQTLIGKVGTRIAMVPSPGSLPASLDGVITVDVYTQIFDSIKTANTEIEKQITRPFDSAAEYQKIKFRFLSSDNYDLVDEEDFIPMTIAQQEDQTFSFLNLKVWEEKEEGGTLPFPGKDKFENFYVTGELKNLIKKGQDSISKPVDALEFEAKLEKKSLKQYKIL